MSMNSKNLSVLAYSNGFTLWHYKTVDAKATVLASNYFNDVANIFNAGDVIIASVDIEGTPAITFLTVSSVSSGVVSVADMFVE